MGDRAVVVGRRPTDGKPWPPEVTFDYHWDQVLARRDDGSRFPRYVECEGCGWLIGCGDAIDTIWHNSCYALAHPDGSSVGDSPLTPPTG